MASQGGMYKLYGTTVQESACGWAGRQPLFPWCKRSAVLADVQAVHDSVLQLLARSAAQVAAILADA